MIIIVIFFLSIAAIVSLRYLCSPIAVLARAGIVSTVECQKKPVITTKNGKPATVRLSPFRGIDYSGLTISKDAILWGKAVGNSMLPKGIGNGDFFLCEKDAMQINHGDVVMIKIDGAGDDGGYKLREFDKFIDGGSRIETFTYSEDGAKHKSRPHEARSLIGKVLYIVK